MWSRRRFLKTTGMVSLLIGSGLLPKFVSAATRKQSQLTILHTNDIHSHIEPFPETDPTYAGLGGFVRLNSLIQRIRREERNVLLFDAGDVFQGTNYFTCFKGEAEFRIMSKIGYDAGTIGNHEFDNGIDGLSSKLKYLNFPLINSNYRFTGTSLEGKIPTFKIFTKGDFKVGVFGLGVDIARLVAEKNRECIAYIDPFSVANEMAKKLKSSYNCNLIVCLSHLGLTSSCSNACDINLAKQTRNLDIIIGGHTHTLMDKPIFVKNLDGKKVLINQVGWGGIALGRLDIAFDINNNIKLTNGKNIKVIG